MANFKIKTYTYSFCIDFLFYNGDRIKTAKIHESVELTF